MKLSGFMCLGMKNICGNFCCKKTSTKKVIKLQSEWHIYICHSAPGAFERMTYIMSTRAEGVNRSIPTACNTHSTSGVQTFGPRCFSRIFKYLWVKLCNLFTGIYKCLAC